MTTALEVDEHTHEELLSVRELLSAHLVARTHQIDPAGYAADLVAVGGIGKAIAVYRLAADLRARAAAVAHLPVQGPADDPYVCQHCTYRGCRVTRMVCCDAEDGGDPVYVGSWCAQAAATFMVQTAIHREGNVKLSVLDAADREWLAETAQVAA